MAGVEAHRNHIKVIFSFASKRRRERRRVSIPLAPTKSNLNSTKTRADILEYEVRRGLKSFAHVRAELRDEPFDSPVTIEPRSLRYYFEHLIKTHKKRTYERDARTAMKYFAPFLERPIDSLLRSELEAHLMSFDRSGDTLSNQKGKLSAAFEAAKEDATLTVNPIAGWTIRKNSHLPPDPYSVDESTAILSALETFAKDDPNAFIPFVFFTTAFATGLRLGELLGLRWPNVHPDHLRICESIVMRRLTDTKTHKTRRVEIPAWLYDMLCQLPSRWQKSFVFLNDDGSHFKDGDRLNKWKRRALAVSGIHHKVRSDGKGRATPSRSSYISRLLKEGAGLALTSSLAGHSIRTMEQNYYADTTAGDERRAEVERILGDDRRSSPPFPPHLGSQKPN